MNHCGHIISLSLFYNNKSLLEVYILNLMANIQNNHRKLCDGLLKAILSFDITFIGINITHVGNLFVFHFYVF